MKLFVGAKGVIHNNGKVLLLRESGNYEEGAQSGKWDVAGGRIEPEETVREGLIREIKEESGLTIVPGPLLGVFDGFPIIKGEKCHVVRLYFLCETMSEEIILSNDHDQFRWVEPKSAKDLLLMDDIAEMLQKAAALVENKRTNLD